MIKTKKNKQEIKTELISKQNAVEKAVKSIQKILKEKNILIKDDDEVELQYGTNGIVVGAKITSPNEESTEISLTGQQFSLDGEEVKNILREQAGEDGEITREALDNILDNVDIDVNLDIPGFNDFIQVKSERPKSSFADYLDDPKIREYDITGKDLEEIIAYDKPFLTEDEKNEEDEFVFADKFKEVVNEQVKSEKYSVDSVVGTENSLININADINISSENIGDKLYGELLNKISLVDLLKFLISCLPVAPGKFSGLNFDILPKIPTVDLMFSIDIALQEILSGILQGIMDFLLGLLEELCALSKDVGAAAIQDFLDSNLPGAKFLQLFEDAGLVDFVEPSGVNSGIGFSPPTDNTRIVEEIGSFLDTVSAVLSPYELAKLMAGNAPAKTRKVILSLMSISDFSFKNKLSDANIQTLFSEMGKIIDDEKLSGFLSTCATSKMDIIGDKLVCPDVDAAQKALLEGKGLTPEEIAKLLDDAKRARDKRVDDINDFLDKINNGTPEIDPFCPKNDTNLPGMKEAPAVELPESAQRQIDSAVNTMFDGIYTVFDKEAIAWNDSIVVMSQVPVKNTADNVEKIQNTIDKIKNKKELSEDEAEIKKMQMQMGMGLNEFHETYHKKASELLEQKSISRTEKMVAPALLDLFASLKERDSNYKIENGEHQLKIDIKDIILSKSAGYGQNIGLSLPSSNIKISFKSDKLIGKAGDYAENYIYKILNNLSDVEKVFLEEERKVKLPEKSSIALDKRTDIDLSVDSPQKSIFVDLLRNYYEDSIEDHEKFNEVASEIFEKLPVSVLDGIGKSISNSDLFEKSKNTIKLETIKFNRKKRACACKDPHLLNLDEIKEKVKEDFAKETCNQTPPEEDSSTRQTERPGPLERAGKDGVVKTTIRTYMIDYFLRGIIVFNEFGLKEPLDNFLKEFLVEEFKRELTIFGETYRDDFLKAVEETYEQNYDKKTEEQEKIEDFGLKFLIEEQLIDVASDIQEDILKSEDRTLPMKEKFVEEWLPLYDTPFYARNVEYFRRAQRYTKALKNETPLLPNDAPFQNFILEKYYDVEMKESASDFERDLARSAFGGEEYVNGIKSVKEWEKYINTKRSEQISEGVVAALNEDIQKVWSKIDYGIRISYTNKVLHERKDRTSEGAQLARRGVNLEDSLKDRVSSRRAGYVYEVDLTEEITPNKKTELNEVIPIVSVSIPTIEDMKGLKIGEPGLNWEDKREELVGLLKNSPDFDLMFSYCFPLDRFLSMMVIQNIIVMRYINGGSVARAFNGTKEQLRSLFYSIMNGGNYTDKDGQLDPFLKSIGGQKGLNSLLSTPPEKLSAKEIQSLANNPGFNYWQIIKFILETPPQIFKGLTEFVDPNIFIASKMALFSRTLSGLDIPVSAFSIALQPATMNPGNWFGPPLTPLGFVYLALSMGFSLGDFEFPSDEEDSSAEPGENEIKPAEPFYPEGTFERNPEECQSCDEEEE